MIYAIFHFIFLTEFFKTAYKTGKAFIFGIIPAVICMIAMEVLPHLPGTDCQTVPFLFDLLLQLPVLAGGIICYAISMILTNIIAAKQFEKSRLIKKRAQAAYHGLRSLLFIFFYNLTDLGCRHKIDSA